MRHLKDKRKGIFFYINDFFEKLTWIGHILFFFDGIKEVFVSRNLTGYFVIDTSQILSTFSISIDGPVVFVPTCEIRE